MVNAMGLQRASWVWVVSVIGVSCGGATQEQPRTGADQPEAAWATECSVDVPCPAGQTCVISPCAVAPCTSGTCQPGDSAAQAGHESGPGGGAPDPFPGSSTATSGSSTAGYGGAASGGATSGGAGSPGSGNTGGGATTGGGSAAGGAGGASPAGACNADAQHCCQPNGSLVRPGGCAPMYRDGVEPATVRAPDGTCKRIKCFLKCMPEDARISTPAGRKRIRDLHPGDAVWSRDCAGKRIRSRVQRVVSHRVDGPHRLRIVQLSDGRTLRASASHPTTSGAVRADADGGNLTHSDGSRRRPRVDDTHRVGSRTRLRADVIPSGETQRRSETRSDVRNGTVGGLRVGDWIDGARVTSSKSVPYPFGRTWDIWVSGPTGFYVSDGVILASTLRAPRCPSGSYKMPPTQKPSGQR